MQTYTDRERGEIANTIAGRVMQGGRGENLVAFDGRDLAADPYVKVDVRADRALQRSGGGWVFRLPIPNMADPTLVARLEAHVLMAPVDAVLRRPNAQRRWRRSRCRRARR